MAWYLTQQQILNSEWKKIIQKANPTIQQILNSQQFSVQLIKHGNQEILAWIQNKYKFFFEELLIRCLVLPDSGDTNDRKFKEPTQSIYFICNVLDTMATNLNTGMLPSSSISASIMCSFAGNGGKITSPQIIIFIIERMFALYSQNDASKLQNTMIPGYFNRIFQCLNRSHGLILINTLRTSQQGKLQKLLDQHGKYEQIVKCIQTVLIIYFNQSGVNTNLQMSVNFGTSAPNITALPTNQSYQTKQGPQTNYPFETKFRLLMKILQNIKNFQKIDSLLLENLLGIVLDILRNFNSIFQGPALSEYIYQNEAAKVFFDICLKDNSDLLFQCHIKCLQILKYCINYMTPLDRCNMFPKLQQMVSILLRSRKPTLKLASILELINEWFLADSGQVNPLLALSSSINRSLGSSLTNSTSVRLYTVSSEFQQLLTSQKIFQHLIRMCVSSPNCNIFHQRVASFLLNVFKSQNEIIISSIYKQNDIIKETISNMKDFKKNAYFGHFMVIIQIYTTRRIQTEDVKQAIIDNTELWGQFSSQILSPHVLEKLKCKCGQFPDTKDGETVQYTVVKKQKIKKEQKPIIIQIQKPIQIKNIQNTTFDTIEPIKINLQDNNSLIIQKQKQQTTQPIISLNFNKKQSGQKEDGPESETFESFLKRKMTETNRLAEERKKSKSKSKTPTKLIKTESKRKRWTAQSDDQNQKTPQNHRKTVSTGQKQIQKQVKQSGQALPKINFHKIGKNSKPKKYIQRKINNENDNYLIKWIQKSKGNSISMR